MSDVARLRTTLAARHTCISIVTPEEPYALGLARDAALSQGRDLWIWSITKGVREGLLAEAAALSDTADPRKGLTFFTGCRDGSICVTLDLVAHLRDVKTLRATRDLLAEFSKSNRQLILIDHSDDLPAVVRSYATPFDVTLPNAAELEHIVREVTRKQNRESRIETQITRNDLDTIVRNLRGLSRRHAEQLITEVIAEDRRFDAEDINQILAGKRRILSAGGLLEFVQTPVDLSEIGGLKRLKGWLAQRTESLGPKAAEFGLEAPRGVLMLGVQGAGKSLCAKAIATAWHRPLLRMDVGALYDKYVGESESRLRDALKQAEAMSPIVLWIDEIEKAFASAAAQSTDGGLSKRMFGSLLTWMQEHSEPVFLVATANDIEALPPELLRKGRFDEIFFADLPDAAVREQIFAIHLKKRHRDPAKFDLKRLAAKSDGFSGAEIEQAVIGAMHSAFSAKRELDTDAIAAVLADSPPLSVTMAEKIANLREWAQGRCVPAD